MEDELVSILLKSGARSILSILKYGSPMLTAVPYHSSNPWKNKYHSDS
jgi:hypothetical protein